MATTQKTVKRLRKAPKARTPKKLAAPLTHAQLLKLAARNRPPQSWYDEQLDPTKPEPPARRASDAPPSSSTPTPTSPPTSRWP